MSLLNHEDIVKHEANQLQKENISFFLNIEYLNISKLLETLQNAECLWGYRNFTLCVQEV